MPITLVSSTPAEGETDFFINKSVELEFNKNIAYSSLTQNVFSIIDITAGTTIPLTITHSYSSAAKVKLQPSTSLRENTEYRVLIVGTDQGLGYSLVAEDAETLTNTLYFEFSTGDSVYQIDETTQKEAASLTLEGDLFLPTNVKALGYDFTISKVRPKNHKHGVPVTLTGDNTIRFTFNKALSTGMDVDDIVDVNLFPLLNANDYLVSGSTLGSVTIPSYSVAVTGQDILVSFDAELPKNLGVQINLSSDIVSLEGDTYGGDMKYSINTELFPQIYGLETIKREVNDVADTYTDDYIGALLFKNTIWLWERVGRIYDIANMSFAAKQYVIYSTILDLMEDREYYKYVVAGTRRQLGDLNVSVDNIIGKVAMKVAKYQKLKDDAFESVIAGWQFRVGTSIAAYDNMAAMINRLWYDINGRYTDSRFNYYQSDIPAANLIPNRRARSNNPIW